MLASEVPYVIAFLALVVLAFWLVGRAADRGWLAQPRHPVVILVAALLFGTSSVMQAIDGKWWVAAFYAVGSLYFASRAWRRWRHPDAPRR